MSLLFLLVVSLLLAAGMGILPPLSGAGLGSVVARAWLGFGILVFLGHYTHYLKQLDKARLRRCSPEPKARHHSVRPGQRSAARM